MRDLLRLASAVLLASLLLAGCSGATGAPGAKGDPGTPGEPGGTGPQGCDASASTALDVVFEAATPVGGFLAAGDRGVLTVRITDVCGRAVAPAALGRLDLYLAGPRATTATRTASKLLNAVTDRNAPDRQHHYVDLRSPSFADAGSPNLEALADGTLRYTLAPITDEASGTYTAGLRVRSSDGAIDRLLLTELQVGTAAPEPEAAGPRDASTCAGCHAGEGPGALQMAHSRSSAFSPAGSPVFDQAPLAGCQLCHNLDGYSQQPAVRKVHALHRGAHQLVPGATHADYGLVADATLAEYVDVRFPAMPEAEKDCAACHADDRWTTRPSRLACGTCHDNVFFDTGTLSPPRMMGTPLTGPCTLDSQCASFGQLVSCNVGNGICERKAHPALASDGACVVCHNADPGSISPIAARHEILSRTQVPGLRLQIASVSGGSQLGGAFAVGDVPAVTFTLADGAGNTISDLKTTSAYSFNAAVAGPTQGPQRVYQVVTSKSTLAFDAASGRYTFTFPTPWPSTSLAPYNATAPGVPLAPGSYSLSVWVYKALSGPSTSYRDAAGDVATLSFGAGQPARPRQLVRTEACNACHVVLQYHGGSRRLAEGCSVCHTRGAEDRGVGGRGTACSTDAMCRGFAEGWEACQDTNSDAVPDICVITTDPTPATTVEFGPMIHSIHVARTLGGYAESATVWPGSYRLVGFANSMFDFSSGLLPVDARNCRSCHADAGNACATDAACGVGQACVAARCANVGWEVPSTRACLSCHDTAAAAGHAALETWASPSGPVETCEVCHGPGDAYAVDAVHALGAGSVLPPR